VIFLCVRFFVSPEPALPHTQYNQISQGNPDMCAKKQFSLAEAMQIGEALGIDWHSFAAEQFRIGLDVELGHDIRDQKTNVTGDDALATGRIALAHLKEFPDYYIRLAAMEKEADDYWAFV
jgi:hypothetical protein